MLTLFDDYPIHQTPDPINTPAAADKDVYERYWFNGYTSDGGLFFGIGAAVILSILITLITTYLLMITGLRLIGGILLLYICYKLYVDVIKGQIENKDIKVDNSSFSKAIFTIILAGSTSAVAYLLDPAIKQLFIEFNTGLN